MIVSRRKDKKKECKREKKKKFVLFSMSSCSTKGSFSYFWVHLYLVGMKEMFDSCGFNLHSFCSLFHILRAWYLIRSIPYDLLLASSTN